MGEEGEEEEREGRGGERMNITGFIFPLSIACCLHLPWMDNTI